METDLSGLVNAGEIGELAPAADTELRKAAVATSQNLGVLVAVLHTELARQRELAAEACEAQAALSQLLSERYADLAKGGDAFSRQE